MRDRDKQQWDETLGDGSRVLIRPMTLGDLECYNAFIEHLSMQSKHHRFLAGVAHLSPAALTRLCDLDYEHEMVFIAIVQKDDYDKEIGASRYASIDSGDTAEIAVAVADRWQHKGLGTLLLRHLIDYARSHGVQHLFSMDAAYNEHMRQLAQHFGFSERPDPQNVHQVIFSLDIGGSRSAS